MNLSSIKNRFPIFKNHPNLVYLDSASTTQTPQIVLDAMDNYYAENRANVHRALYALGEKATEQYEEARKKIAAFINAEPEEIIFTSGTTHGLNLLAYILSFKKGDNIVLTQLEHHANLIPWQTVAKCTGAEMRFIEFTSNYELDLESAKKLIDKNTKLVSFSALSNSLGTHAPIEELVKLAHRYDALTIIDAAQLAAHESINVKKLKCDFLVFSGHKMYGPTGIGVLYGKKEHLEKLEPFFFGGEMIKEVSYDYATWADLPHKFEGGTPNIAAAIGFSSTVDFIQQIGWKTIQEHEQGLTSYLFSKLPSFVTVIGPKSSKNRSGIISFTIEGIHPHDIAEILNRDEICIRSGHHCTMPLMKQLGISGTARISLGVYNNNEDIDTLLAGLEEVKKIFRI